jgi:hypothetical protein
LEAEWDDAKRKLRRWDGWEERLDFDLFVFGIQDCLAVDEVVGHLFTLLAGRCGAYRHRRQWRWTRGGRLMANGSTNEAKAAMAALSRPPVLPLMPPEFTGIPEEDQDVLREAAKGDAAALEQSRKYLTDRRYTRRWGNPVYAARCWLVSQTCGTDLVVARATHNYADQLADDLGIGRANALEKLAITRVVNNWLMVGVLEAKECGLGGEQQGAWAGGTVPVPGRTAADAGCEDPLLPSRGDDGGVGHPPATRLGDRTDRSSRPRWKGERVVVLHHADPWSQLTSPSHRRQLVIPAGGVEDAFGDPLQSVEGGHRLNAGLGPVGLGGWLRGTRRDRVTGLLLSPRDRPAAARRQPA